MPVSEAEIERLARTMIDQHGVGAGRAAAERVNQMIDRGDWYGRDVWARVVHAIHERQGFELPPPRPGAQDVTHQ